jgi:hypothetical protein
VCRRTSESRLTVACLFQLFFGMMEAATLGAAVHLLIHHRTTDLTTSQTSSACNCWAVEATSHILV